MGAPKKQRATEPDTKASGWAAVLSNALKGKPDIVRIEFGGTNLYAGIQNHITDFNGKLW